MKITLAKEMFCSILLLSFKEKLERISSREVEILKLHTEIEGLKREKKQLERQQQELRDNIENEFTGKWKVCMCSIRPH